MYKSICKTDRCGRPVRTRGWCNTCYERQRRGEYSEWSEEDREKARESCRRWYAKHGKAYYEKHRERQKEAIRKYQNTEKGRERQRAGCLAYYHRNKERINARKREERRIKREENFG